MCRAVCTEAGCTVTPQKTSRHRQRRHLGYAGTTDDTWDVHRLSSTKLGVPREPKWHKILHLTSANQVPISKGGQLFSMHPKGKIWTRVPWGECLRDPVLYSLYQQQDETGNDPYSGFALNYWHTPPLTSSGTGLCTGFRLVKHPEANSTY